MVKGEGGLKPLSDKDKRTVRDSALETLGADRHLDVSFSSSAVTAHEGGYTVTGELSIGGRVNTVDLELGVLRADGTATLTALVPVEQTAFGIKPYTGLMGGLRVRDRVDVRLEAVVADPPGV